VARTRVPLRAVGPDDAPPSKPMTLLEAIESGNYLDILMAQRRDIVASLPEEKGPAKAALHRQLSILSEKIEQLEAADPEDAEDDVPDEPFSSATI